MRRTLCAGLILAGCANHRLEALELRVAALESRGPAAPISAVSSADEAAASELLRAASESATNGDYDAARAALGELRRRYPNTRVATRATRLEAEVNVIGQPAPPTTVTRWFTPATSDLRGRGTTVVAFFETWCPHCQREMPNIAEMARSMPEIQFLALTKLSRNTTDEDVYAMIEAGRWPFAVGLEDGSMTTAFAVEGIPAAAVVRDGKIVWRGHPAKLKAETIRDLAR